MALTCQTDSRIADSNRNWQAACNIDVSNWNKSNEFIIATYALSDSANPDSDFKLQWRRAAGVFADVAADTEVCWGTATVLVDGNAVGGAAGCLATVDDSEENEGDNLCAALNVADGDYWEGQWALGFGSGAQDEQEYEIQLVSIDWANSAVLQTTITTASAESPSISPSVSPSVSPSESPSISPSSSESPSESPSASPSVSPSESPSVSPSESPSLSPSASESPSDHLALVHRRLHRHQ